MIRKFQRQDLEAAVKIWLAANKEAHDFIDPCYWEGYKDAETGEKEYCMLWIK